MQKESLNTRQFIWLLVCTISSFAALQVPSLLILQAQQDAWLSVIGGWFLDVLLALIYAYMGIRFAGENFIQYSMTILGKYAGRIIGILFPIFFVIVSVGLMLDLSILFKMYFLPRTPIEVISISGFLTIGYGARKGIEVIARNAEYMTPLFIFSIVILGLLLLPSANIEQLKPQLVHGLSPFLIGSPFILSYFGICIIMAMYIPICNRPENGFLSKFIAVTVGAFTVEIIIVMSIGVFGLEQTKVLYNPGLELSRMVGVGSFLERIEIIYMIISIGAGILTIASLIWAASLGISQIVGLQTYKPLVFPIVLLSIILSLTSFPRSVEMINFAKYSYPIFAAFVEAGLEIFLFVMAFILNKRGNGNAF